MAMAGCMLHSVSPLSQALRSPLTEQGGEVPQTMTGLYSETRCI